jgi:TRAP-type uncharacterized transport system fused permease subunit
MCHENFAIKAEGADSMRTGYASMRFGWHAFVIPFIFVTSPAFLMQGRPMLILLELATASWLPDYSINSDVVQPTAMARTEKKLQSLFSIH